MRNFLFALMFGTSIAQAQVFDVQITDAYVEGIIDPQMVVKYEARVNDDWVKQAEYKLFTVPGEHMVCIGTNSRRDIEHCRKTVLNLKKPSLNLEVIGYDANKNIVANTNVNIDTSNFIDVAYPGESKSGGQTIFKWVHYYYVKTVLIYKEWKADGVIKTRLNHVTNTVDSVELIVTEK